MLTIIIITAKDYTIGKLFFKETLKNSEYPE